MPTRWWRRLIAKAGNFRPGYKASRPAAFAFFQRARAIAESLARASALRCCLGRFPAAARLGLDFFMLERPLTAAVRLLAGLEPSPVEVPRIRFSCLCSESIRSLRPAAKRSCCAERFVSAFIRASVRLSGPNVKQ